jgi:cytochrome c biogenesis protein CcmG/thiol:disulfide interchange protein DsbE
MKRTTAATAALILFALTAAFAAACAPDKAEPRTESPAETAPDFALTDLQGNAVTLADYKGKVLFLNFWATWCPPCRREIPDFIEAYKELKGEGLEILGVSVDEVTAAALLDWVRKTGINYPVALATPEIVQAYRPGEFIPATIVIDGKGVIRHRQSELMDKETLVRLFREYSK